MKRVVIPVVVSAMALVLSGCPTPVPPGYQAPRIESVEVTPQPARPGDVLTVRIEASDDQGVTGGGVRNMVTPSGTTLFGSMSCTSETVPVGEPGDRTHVVMTITCPVPTFASNGTWELDVVVGDGMPPTANYPGRQTMIPFEVTGGTDDREPPRLISYEIEPNTVDQETTFTLTARLHDESLPVGMGHGQVIFDFTKPFAQNSTFVCRYPTFTPVAATEVEVVVDCEPHDFRVPGRSETGVHRGRMEVRDALNHLTDIEMVVDVQPAP